MKNKKIIDEDIEYLDEFFPKGEANSKRGYAMVLLALARKQGRGETIKQLEKEIKEFGDSFASTEVSDYSEGYSNGVKFACNKIIDMIQSQWDEKARMRKQDSTSNKVTPPALKSKSNKRDGSPADTANTVDTKNKSKKEEKK